MGTAIAITTTERYGGCPRCGACHRILSVGCDFWGMCWGHQVKWYCGFNIFPSWEHETVEEWVDNSWWLSNFELVPPVYPTDEMLITDRPQWLGPGRVYCPDDSSWLIRSFQEAKAICIPSNLSAVRT